MILCARYPSHPRDFADLTSPIHLSELEDLFSSCWELPQGWLQGDLLVKFEPGFARLVLDRLVLHGRLDEADRLELKLKQLKIISTSLVDPPLLRSLHHMACSGGTLISKLIASLPNVALINETHPLNRKLTGFHPTDPLLLLEQNWRSLSKEEVREAFVTDLIQALSICRNQGIELVVREHSHTDFCVGAKPFNEQPVRTWMQPNVRMRSLVSVRHPLDSWLGMVAAGWHKQLQPATLHEYCSRYHLFLDETSEVPVLYYEDLCRDPIAGLEQLCELLLLPMDSSALAKFGKIILSGDSGRTDLDRVEPRARRPIPNSVETELSTANARKALEELCDRLDYDHDWPK